jgi:serine/threonine protein kinase
MLIEGQQLGQYRFGRLLGSGGMGDVYLAEDMQLRRKVAIKVIWTDTSLYPDDDVARETARLFLREAQLIAGLEHIHILPLYASGEGSINGRAMMYMVMPYRHEGSLADWLHKHRDAVPLSPWVVARIVYQAASGLQHAHNHHIIHQDVKPANFLIHGYSDHASQLNLQLADFGVAKLVMTTSQSQIIRGTPTYMAPERWEGRPVPASDQYALAIMAYELLTGHPPFEGNNHEQLWYQHCYVKPQPPSTLNPNVPRTLDTVLLRALAKNPRGRYRSVSAFADAFQRALFGIEKTEQGISLSDTRILEEVTSEVDVSDDVVQDNRQRRRSPIGKIVLLAVVFVVVAGSAGLLYFNRLTPLNISRVNSRGSSQPVATHQIGTSTPQATATATLDSNATATVNGQATINAQATATVNGQATATAVAIAIANAQATATASSLAATATASSLAATATAYATAVTSGTQELNDPLQDDSGGYGWDVAPFPGGGGCAFTQGAYHASMPQNGYLAPCFAQATNFSNFSYQVQMTIVKGDQGGIIFRANAHNGSFYYFSINRKGQYALESYNNYKPVQVLNKGSSSAIKTELGQPNLIAVVAIGSSFDLYVNEQHLVTVGDSTYSSGQVGVIAEDIGSPAEVVFSDALAWSR